MCSWPECRTNAKVTQAHLKAVPVEYASDWHRTREPVATDSPANHNHPVFCTSSQIQASFHSSFSVSSVPSCSRNWIAETACLNDS